MKCVNESNNRIRNISLKIGKFGNSSNQVDINNLLIY